MLLLATLASKMQVLTLPVFKVTDAVHARGSFMYSQLWALGRTASVEQLKKEDPSFEYVSAGDVPLPRTSQQEEKSEDPPRPRPLTKAEIAEYVQIYATAARDAVERAGFDGVEIHGANGFLLDQFLKETSNNRTDEYGGSPENNARFVLDVVAAVSAAVGEERVGLRLSPWITLFGTRTCFPKTYLPYHLPFMLTIHRGRKPWEQSDPCVHLSCHGATQTPPELRVLARR
jgi:NADPH2 dehydrogenase